MLICPNLLITNFLIYVQLWVQLGTVFSLQRWCKTWRLVTSVTLVTLSWAITRPPNQSHRYRHLPRSKSRRRRRQRRKYLCRLAPSVSRYLRILKTDDRSLMLKLHTHMCIINLTCLICDYTSTLLCCSRRVTGILTTTTRRRKTMRLRRRRRSRLQASPASHRDR